MGVEVVLIKRLVKQLFMVNKVICPQCYSLFFVCFLFSFLYFSCILLLIYLFLPICLVAKLPHPKICIGCPMLPMSRQVAIDVSRGPMPQQGQDFRWLCDETPWWHLMLNSFVALCPDDFASPMDQQPCALVAPL